MGIGNSSPLPQYVTTLIQVTVTRTVGTYGLTESDRDDLEQQITLEVVRRRSKFDPAKAQENTFLARLVKHAVADIIAARKASNRDYRRVEGAMDEWVKDTAGQWVRRGDAVAEDGDPRRGNGSDLSPEDLRDLTMDIADAAAKLPGRLRGILDHLKSLGSVREVAKVTGLHPSSVYDAMKRIKEHFAKAGLDDYLPRHRRNPTDSDGRR